MAKNSANAVQNPFWPSLAGEDASANESVNDEPVDHADLRGAECALQVLSVSESSKGQDLDEELPAALYPHSHRREYRVHLPPGYDPTVPVPMIMVLHGCHQTHLDIQQVSQFDTIADREGAVVVYPWVTGYRGLRTINCWGWWMRSHRTRGQGEVEDLARIARHVASHYAIDTSRRYICGLSSGACMSVVSLVAASATWTAGASVAGVPYGEDARAVRISRFLAPRFKPGWQLVHKLQLMHGHRAPPPLLVVQSTTDDVVTTANAKHLRDQWLSASGMASVADCENSGTTQDRSWQLQGHHDRQGRLQTLYFTIENLIHGWFGGGQGSYSTPEAPNLSELIWWFFQQHSGYKKTADIKVVDTGSK